MQNLDRFNFKIAIHSKKINGCDLPCGVYDVFGFQKSFTLLQIIVFFNQEKYFIDSSTHSFTLLQCTGLKDKNGKLVFEGDILKIPKEYHFKNMQKVVIAWKDGCFGFEGKGFSEFRTDTEIELFEIIGNQFLNPELVEKI